MPQQLYTNNKTKIKIKADKVKFILKTIGLLPVLPVKFYLPINVELKRQP